MGRRQHGVARGNVVLGVLSVLSAALVAAQPASAGDNGNHYGQLKHDTVASPPPDSGSTTGSGATTTSVTSGNGPTAPLVNSFTATLAFVGADGKRVTVGSSPVKAVITIKNTSTTTTAFESALISVAGGFTVCTSPVPCTSVPDVDSGFTGSYFGSSIFVQGSPGVAPGSSLTVGAWLRPPATCSVAGLAWTVQVRQSTNLSGATFTGGPTTPLGFLKFDGQPPVATQYNSNMAPAPSVTSYDACGVGAPPTNTVSLTDALGLLTGGGSGTVSGNDTSFGSLQFTAFDQADSLTANAIDYTSSDPSNSFLVAEKVQPCNPGDCPTMTLDSQPKTSAVIAATPGQGDALVSGSATGPDNTLCNASGSGISDSEISSTIAVDTPVSKTVTITIAKALVNAISNNGAPFMTVCLRVPGQPDMVLPDCTKATVTSPPPCVLKRGKHKADEVITVELPEGDPHLGVY